MSSIEGLDDFLLDLEGLDDVLLDAATIALSKGLKRTVAAAKMLAPVDTGQLRNSITSTVTREENKVHGQVIATAAHAKFVELGTGDRGHASDNGKAPGLATYTSGWPGQAAQPFMYPAVQVTKDQVLDDVAKDIGKEIGRNMGGV